MTVAAARTFPFPQPDMTLPPPEYATLRAEEPVTKIQLPNGAEAWLVTRYEDVRRLLADPRLGKAASTAPGAARILPISQGSKSLFSTDPPEHTRLRKLITHAFTNRQTQKLAPRVTEIAEDCIDAIEAAGPGADLIELLALPLPIRVICEMLGVPYEDVGRFREWSDKMLATTAYSPEEIHASRGQLNAYLAERIAAKRDEPGDDLLDVLIAAREDGDRMDEEELLAFGHTLLGAGYHATAAQLIHAVLLLLSHEDQLARLRADAALLPTAVDEMLRVSAAGGQAGSIRFAKEDIEVAGTTIAAGEALVLSVVSANRDGARYECPEDIDIARTPNPHLTFGHGAHHCLGAPLARIEMMAAIGGLLSRFPDLHLAVPVSELRWTAGMLLNRPETLPLAW